MYVLIGKSSSGKTTIERMITEQSEKVLGRKLSRIISYTTRPKRENEVEDIDYHYISEEEFKKKLNEGFFIENTQYRGWYYSIAKEDCTDDKIVIVEPVGLQQLQSIKDLNITTFYIETDNLKRLLRILKRGDDSKEILRRYYADEELFKGLGQKVNYIIGNNNDDNGQKAVDEILRLIKFKIGDYVYAKGFNNTYAIGQIHDIIESGILCNWSDYVISDLKNLPTKVGEFNEYTKIKWQFVNNKDVELLNISE